MTAARKTRPRAPRTGDVRYMYSFSQHYPKLRRVRFVYYKHATYQDVTGEAREGARDFEDEWGVFEERPEGWSLCGRNNTENVLDLTELTRNDQFHFGTYAACVKAIRAWCAEVVVAKRDELARAERESMAAMAIPDKEPPR